MKDSHIGLLKLRVAGDNARRLAAYEKDPATVGAAPGHGRSGLEIDMVESTTPTLQPEARLDGCPECVVNTALPRSIDPLPDGGFVAAYLCADCGHAWVTSWRD